MHAVLPCTVQQWKFKKFNVQLNVDLLNYQIKTEYAPAPRHLLTLGVGYGSIMMERGIPYSFEAKNMDPEKFRSNNPFFTNAYFSYTATLIYKYHPFKPKEIQADKHNQGFYLFTKLRFIGPANKSRYEHLDYRSNYVFKPGIGFGINVKFNKKGTLGLDLHQGVGLVVNSYLNYAEVWAVFKASIYLMLYSQ